MSAPRRALALALLVLPLAPAFPAAEPPPVDSTVAEYQLLRDDIPLAKVVVSLEVRPDGAYVYESRTEPTGLMAVFRDGEVVERSEGLWSVSGFAPSHYSYTRRYGETLREVRVDFDRSAGKVANRAGGTTWSMAVPMNAQDKLSQQLGLIAALARGLRELSIPVADGGKLKTYRYELQGRETLHTSAGELATLRVMRRRDDRPSTLLLWCAPSLGYLPVRVDRREGDQLYRMDLSTVRRQPNAASP